MTLENYKCPLVRHYLYRWGIYIMATHILQLCAHWLLMAHFQQMVTWVGLELDGAGVIREGGVTRSGWKMETFTIMSTVWA